jgi:hypothetical protein
VVAAPEGFAGVSPPRPRSDAGKGAVDAPEGHLTEDYLAPQPIAALRPGDDDGSL